MGSRKYREILFSLKVPLLNVNIRKVLQNIMSPDKFELRLQNLMDKGNYLDLMSYIYSGDPKTGHVRFSNGRPWFGFRMVQFLNGPKKWLPIHWPRPFI